MATGGIAERPSLSAYDSRTRSVWLTQLVLAASVILISVVVLALAPATFTVWSFVVGVLLIILITLVTLAVPWQRLPPAAIMAVPFADAVAIGFTAYRSDLRLSYLWVFPVMWVAMYFSATVLAAMIALITLIIGLDIATAYTNSGLLRLIIVVLSLSFIGITAHLALRQVRAFRRLLRRQANRLNVNLTRRSSQQRRANEILNGVDSGLLRITLDGRILAVNDAYTQLYGLDPLDPSLPARSVEYMGPRGMPVPRPDRPYVRAARGETFEDVLVWLFTGQGEWRALSVSAKRLSAVDDEEASTLIVAHDVTEVTMAERERDRLTAIASHELKHPLTIMMANAELALDSDEVSPKTQERLETILAASERMLQMTVSMLTTSDAPKVPRTHRAQLDLRNVLMDSVESFAPSAQSHDVRLMVRVEEPLRIDADEFRLRQVIDNLVSNAIKYTPPDGEAQITGTARDGRVTVVVADSGIGISEADLPRILTPYFRTEKAKETAAGTGLGLAISRDIVVEHGGTLTIDSKDGRGTRVTLEFPEVSMARGEESDGEVSGD